MNLSKWLLVVFVIFNFGVIAVMNKPDQNPIVLQQDDQVTFSAPTTSVPEERVNYTLQQEDVCPAFMDYHKTIAQLKKWNDLCPKLTELGTYGKSTKGNDLFYIRVSNKNSKAIKQPVLITSCIHGNEPLSASTTMWYIGDILDKYGDDEEITKLVDTRDLYFIPVVSPDSYPNSRHVDGVDPNRNFDSNPSAQPIEALKKFFLMIKPKAVMSGHTWGRVYLVPYGDKMANSPNHDDYTRIMNEMKTLSGYRWMRACDMYMGGGRLNNPNPQQGNNQIINHNIVMPPIQQAPRRGRWAVPAVQQQPVVQKVPQPQPQKTSVPIFGTECDWYYKNGAMSVIVEFGQHQRIPSTQDTKVEFDKTYKAMLLFVREAPQCQVKN